MPFKPTKETQMALKVALLLTLSLGLFFTLSGSQRRPRHCVPEFETRRLAGKTAVLPDYPATPETPGSQGLVVAAVLFNSEGGVEKVNISEAPSAEFGHEVVRALEQWKLEARYNGAGEALETQTIVRFHFIFEDGKGSVDAATEEEQKEVRHLSKVCNSRL
jgi:hypothetical protein